MRVFNRSKNPKKPNWWLTYYVERKRVREPGKGTREASLVYAKEISRQIKDGVWIHPRQRPHGKDSFATYGRTVIDKRAARGVKTADKDERGHLENHLIPEFGPVALRDLTHKRLMLGFERIAAKGLGGRTVRNIHSTLQAVLHNAARDEMIPFAPAPLAVRHDELPPAIDKDPEWRDSAVFTVDEVRTLIACAEIPIAFRVLYLTLAITGARLGEITSLKVRDFQRIAEPLATLTVVALKTGRHRGHGRLRRHIPVHPDLAAWLDWWLAHEYEIQHCRRPTPDSLLFPTLSERRRRAGLETISQQEVHGQWSDHHLPAASLRHRRIHDLRRTLTSALRAAGVQGDQVAAITHRPTGHLMQDQYTSWQWEALCAEVMRVKWGLLTPGGHTRGATRGPIPQVAKIKDAQQARLRAPKGVK